MSDKLICYKKTVMEYLEAAKKVLDTFSSNEGKIAPPSMKEYVYVAKMIQDEIYSRSRK